MHHLSGEPTLVLSARHSDDREQIAGVCEQTGRPVHVMDSWRAPESLRDRDVRLYAEPLFGEAVAGDLNLTLLDPAADWLAGVPRTLLGRTVTKTTFEQVARMPFPAHVNSCDDKLGGVPGRVYRTAAALPSGVDPNADVLWAEPVHFSCEVRLFCVAGEVTAGSGYWRDGQLWQVELKETGLRAAAEEFAADVFDCAADGLPSHVVLDAGLVDGRLAVIEANGAWGSGLYASDPESALACVLGASMPREHAAGLPSDIRREPDPAIWD